jgi:surface antigen
MRAYAAPIIALSLVAAWSAPAIADPPGHAPAHGWRKHHGRHHEDRDRDYVSYTGEHWQHDYGIRSGHCNREAVATVVGGVVGGVLGSRIASSDNRLVATIVGAAAGALIGKKIGHELDAGDRGCFGHALEIGEPGRRVTWTNDSTSVRYEMIPGSYRKRDGAPCRSFTLWVIAGGHKSSQIGVACRSRPGLWQVVD